VVRMGVHPSDLCPTFSQAPVRVYDPVFRPGQGQHSIPKDSPYRLIKKKTAPNSPAATTAVATQIIHPTPSALRERSYSPGR